MERPIKLPLAVLYLFILLCVMLTILAVENVVNTLVGIGLLISGIFIYYVKEFFEAKHENALYLGNF